MQGFLTEIRTIELDLGVDPQFMIFDKLQCIVC